MLNKNYTNKMDAMEIRIPKLSLLKNEKKLFVNLREYISALGSLKFRGQNVSKLITANLMAERRFVESLDPVTFEKLIHVLQVLVSNKISRSKAQRIFTSEFMSECRKVKNKLKKSMMKYRFYIEKLQECQRSVWLTREKVQKYSSMIDDAQTAIKNYTQDKKEYKNRMNGIKGLKQDLYKRLKRHSKNIQNYDSAMLKENVLRKKIDRLSSTLKKNVTDRIHFKIDTAIDYTIGDENRFPTEMISESIYDLVSHSLILVEPPPDVSVMAFNQGIQQPTMSRNLFSPENAKKVVHLKHQLNDKPTKNIYDEVNQMILDLHKMNANSTEIDMVNVEKIKVDIPKENVTTKQRNGLFPNLKKRLFRKEQS